MTIVFDSLSSHPEVIKQKQKNYKFNFQIRMRGVCVGILNRIFEEAKRNHWTHRRLVIEITNKIWSTETYKSLSFQYQSYVQGYCDCLIKQLEYDHIVWKMYHPTLGLLESKDISKDDWNKIISEKSNFVWKNTINDMPYGETAEERTKRNASK